MPPAHRPRLAHCRLFRPQTPTTDPSHRSRPQIPATDPSDNYNYSYSYSYSYSYGYSYSYSYSYSCSHNYSYNENYSYSYNYNYSYSYSYSCMYISHQGRVGNSRVSGFPIAPAVSLASFEAARRDN